MDGSAHLVAGNPHDASDLVQAALESTYALAARPGGWRAGCVRPLRVASGLVAPADAPADPCQQ